LIFGHSVRPSRGTCGPFFSLMCRALYIFVRTTVCVSGEAAPHRQSRQGTRATYDRNVERHPRLNGYHIPAEPSSGHREVAARRAASRGLGAGRERDRRQRRAHASRPRDVSACCERLDRDRLDPQRPLFRSVLLLFGVLPVDVHSLALASLVPGRGFLESSSSLLHRRWIHERVLDAEGDGTRICDRVYFECRLPSLGRSARTRRAGYLPSPARAAPSHFGTRQHNLGPL